MRYPFFIFFDKFFYYGFDNRNKSSLHMSVVAGKNGFKSVTKPIQWIRHYLTSDEESIYGNSLLSDMIRADEKGNFILIPKCNFDVEICLDIVRTQEKYNTVCILTNDNDFAPLLDYLRKRGKKIVLIYTNPVRETLLNKAHYKINAQCVKSSICGIKKSSETFAEYKKRTSP